MKYKIIIPKEEDFELLSIGEETIKLAIPMIQDKEEPKQETLEEAAEKEFPLLDTKWCRTGAAEEENLQLLGHRKSFIKGAVWQQERMYSEEDLFNFAIFCSNNHSLDDSDKDNICWQPIFKDNIKLTMKEMFEQFKKRNKI